MPQEAAGLAVAQEPEVTVAYYIDSPLDEEKVAAVEAEVDFVMGDLEQLLQEQLVSLVEDIAEYQTARKGKAVVTDPSPQKDHASIMVLEEDLAAAATTRPDELITLQPGGGSIWFVQRMPHSGSVASGSTQISRLPDIFPASTSEAPQASASEAPQASALEAPQASASAAQQALAPAASASAA